MHLTGTWTLKSYNISQQLRSVSTTGPWICCLSLVALNQLGSTIAWVFGINVYLRSHTNQDFMMSIVQAHIDERHYTASDSIVCYFCFPRIGTAVALRPGDFLIFNPQEPHSISSKCNPEDDVYCILSYLKTAIVGLNDNMNEVV